MSHQTRVAVCAKHLERGVKDVMGKAVSKPISITKVTNDPHYTCYCGRGADWYFHDKTKRGESGEEIKITVHEPIGIGRVAAASRR